MSTGTTEGRSGFDAAIGEDSVPVRDTRRSVTWWLACGVALLAVGVLVYWYLFYYGVSNVWNGDGLDQTFAALYKYNLIVRAFLANPSSGLSQWSWNLGLGAGTLGTLSYYVADPFALLSLLVPIGRLEYAYEALYFLRLFLAGLAAYAYLRKMKAAEFAAVTGSLMYVFVTFSMYIALHHPYFANPMLYLPLLLLGVEQVLARQRPYLLVFAAFIAAVSSFYFFWQLSIVVVVYSVARYLEITPEGERVRRLARTGLGVAGWYVLGMALAAFVLAPAVVAFLDSSRAGWHQPLPLLHTLAEYRSYLLSLWSARNPSNSAFMGFSILGFLMLPVLFMRRRQHTAIKAMVVLFAVFLTFPFFGSLFNGLAFPSYRFQFMWGLFLAAGAVLVLSERTALSGRELLAVLAGLVLSTVAVWAAAGGPDPANMAPLGVGALMWGCFAAEWGITRRRARAAVAEAPGPGPWSPVARAAVCALVVVGIGLNAAATFDMAFNPVLRDFVPLGQVLQRYRDNPGSIAATLPRDGFYRVDKQVTVRGSNLEITSSNDPLVQGYNGLDFYFSMVGRPLFDYLRDLDVRSMRNSFDYEGLDDRAVLDTLAGVRYYLAAADATQYAPYGFTPISSVGTTTVFLNRFALPMGYVYHAAVPASDYAAMPPLERQQALLQGAVLETGAAPAVPRFTVRDEVIDVPYSVTATAGATWDATARRIVTGRKGGTLVFHFAPVPDAELYLDMTGISYQMKGVAGDTSAPASGSFLMQWARDLGVTERAEEADLILSFGTTGKSKHERTEPPANPYYWGDDSDLINLGYFAAGRGRAYLRTSQRTTIDYASLKVYAVPMGRFPERVGRLAADGMRDVRITGSSMTGTVTSNGDGLLVLSIPYDSGWSATVDGKVVGVARANVGFCGIPVTSGTHQIRMTYLTPGLVPGSVTSVIALLAVGGMILTRRRPKRPPATEDGGAASVSE